MLATLFSQHKTKIIIGLIIVAIIVVAVIVMKNKSKAIGEQQQ